MPIRTIAVDLFSADEHAVLAQWFGVDPPSCAKDIVVAEAARRLGFEEEPGHYRLLDAVVAFIVLERVEKDLPQWAASCDEDGNLIEARKYRDEATVPDRTVLMVPRYLFTLNWADSSFFTVEHRSSWPEAYFVTWVPHYDRFVVTGSMDCPDVIGYCDFALGAFGVDTRLKDGAKRIICGQWASQRDEGGAQRWACLFGTGLISEPEASAWADEVWREEEDAEDEDAA
jgi:hypothetical protein